MAIVNVHQAKTQLSKLLERVEAGEEIFIARAGTPVARLVPVRRARGERPLGLLAGKGFWVAEDFDSPETNEEISRLFNEGQLFPVDSSDS